MVSIFVGSGAGFARGSGATLGGSGVLGSAVQGRSGEGVSVNAATGNLLITQQDDFLVGRGPDSAVSRTYNSLAQVSDDNGDQWRFGSQRRLANWTGVANTSGATVDRVGEDGSVITYTYDVGLGYYRATDGAGAHDKIVNVGHWIWTDGDTQASEVYDIGGVLINTTDTDGNSLSFSYHMHNGSWRLSRATTSNGEYQDYIWSGENVSQIVTGYTDLASGTPKTLTRTRYAYDGQNRLVQVTVDLSPEDNSVADSRTYVTTYTYDGSSKRVASITQTDGSSLAIAYDAAGRVATLTQIVAAGDVRVTRIGYGVNVASVTGPDDQVTRLWYDNKKQLVQLMSPPATKGGVSQVLQYEYDASGNLIRTIETDSVNASIPANLVNAAGWGDGEVAGRGENLVDDSGWPQDVDGTLPANGVIGGSAWTPHYVGETEWTVTTGPYGATVVSMKAGQNDAVGEGGGAQSTLFDIDPKKAYEFTYYFKLDAPAKHSIYFGAADIYTGQPGYVEFAHDGSDSINPYFFSVDAAWQNANLTVGKWYKVVGYVLPEGSANVSRYDLGGLYDTTTGDRVANAEAFRWNEGRAADKSGTRFFNFYGTDVSKNTHFWKPEVREVSDFAILRTGEKLDIVKDRNLIERSLPGGWNDVPWANGDNEARWSEMLGPDGSWRVGLETGQFDNSGDGGGGYPKLLVSL